MPLLLSGNGTGLGMCLLNCVAHRAVPVTGHKEWRERRVDPRAAHLEGLSVDCMWEVAWSSGQALGLREKLQGCPKLSPGFWECGIVQRAKEYI